MARIASLLGAWTREGGRAVLASRALPEFWSRRLAALGVDVAEAPASFQELARDAVERGAAAACVDGYGFSQDDVRTLARSLPVVRIDDDVDGADVPADVLVEANLGAEARVQVPDGTGARVLAGAAYALLRPEFDDLPPRAPDAASRVLVTFGSSDPARVTVRCAEALVRRRPSGRRVAVVAGPSMHPADRAALEELESAGEVELMRGVADMATALRSARVGV
ncbi:MAG: hypothetical protein AAFX50_20300, partial [Acidobacteriota bacterium]